MSISLYSAIEGRRWLFRSTDGEMCSPAHVVTVHRPHTHYKPLQNYQSFRMTLQE